jgi:ribose-phosphate pyrophosphokinase
VTGAGPLLFSTSAYAPLAAAIAGSGGFAGGERECTRFPDGERYQRLLSDVAGRAVIALGGTISDEDTLELYDLACGLVQEGARQLTLVIPFFGCGTMERAVRPGEVVTAKTRARLLSSIPTPGEGARVALLDLHAAGISHYFEGAMRPVHLYGKKVIVEAVRAVGGADYVLACTDAGRAKWVESLANELGVPASFVFKRRLDGARTEVTAVSAQVEGRRVVIYDDMIRTGGSLLGAARAYHEAGARSIAVVATHAVLPGDALERIARSGLIERIVCTDSHPRALALRGDFLDVVSVAGLLAGFLGGTP